LTRALVALANTWTLSATPYGWLSFATHIHRSLKPDGTWMLIEPLAGDATEDNLGPVGRVAYAFSTMACVPVSLS
jgi:hypothetical protein